MLFKAKTVCAAVMMAALAALACLGQGLPRNAFEGVQIEPPANRHIRVENQFGEVAAEVWKEKYVSVAATIEGAVPFPRSPVVIDNSSQLLSIRIIRRPIDPPAAVRVVVKLPENAHLEVITGKGQLSLRGTPAWASLRSVSGEVGVEFQGPADTDIMAKSVSGVVKSQLPQLLTNSGNVLQARIGSGSQTLRVNTQSGNISLVPAAATAISQTTSARSARQAPEDETAVVPIKAAGVPAPRVEDQEISEGDVIRVDSQLVTLNLSVIDRKTNRGLAGLSKSDFRLFENGAEQEILQFESASAPFDLLLLIDLSGSTRDKVKLIRSAALRFIDAARSFDRIGVISFASAPTVVAPLTLNRQTLRQRVNSMDTATGDTKLYDATDFAVKELLADAKNARRTAIIVMSDGLDGNIDGVQGEGSKLAYKELLSRVAEFDGVLYTLWLNTEYESLSPLDTQPEAFDAGHDRMLELSETGGGVFYEVDRLEDLAGAYERVVADLGTVYGLAYRPLDKVRDGKWRAIRVNIDRPSAVARGKRGYYAN
ncbi:MAG TPA: VWA domain-containing protein [Pyrinomonadaceae bacterium]|nr:VWA domain-containing protein [Pyrinomonadaceae bacterium]